MFDKKDKNFAKDVGSICKELREIVIELRKTNKNLASKLDLLERKFTSLILNLYEEN